MDTAHLHDHLDTAHLHNPTHRSMNAALLHILKGMINWPLFIASYEHSKAICGYSDDENLLRLQRALKGAALEAMVPLLYLPSGLQEAVATLKLRFGRPEVIVERLIEKVRRMPVPRADRLETLAEFGFAV
uniref:Uncharacterized protein n=1 Tax=Anopheles epiroticus TaxID=199890 RepID=A0A182PWM0_9DIPT